jgi:hypothetical protein
MKLCLNYGCVERNSREYRKALRQCRKNKKRFGVAFDDSETWNLDIVVLQWCYDNNVHPDPIIKKCRFSDRLIEDWIDEYYETDLSRYKCGFEEYMKLYDTIYRNIIEDIFYEIRTKFRYQFCEFILPRLKRFKEISLAYPFDLGIEGWDKYIQEVINEIENKKTFEKFVDRIADFWW